MSEELKPCPWCQRVPDASNDAAFRLTDGEKYGALQCCVIGPEVRTDYKPVAYWKQRAIDAWNDRATPPAPSTASEVGELPQRIQAALDLLADATLPRDTWRDVSNVLHACRDELAAFRTQAEGAKE